MCLVSNQIDVMIEEAPHIEPHEVYYCLDDTVKGFFGGTMKLIKKTPWKWTFCLYSQSKYDISVNNANARNPFKIFLLLFFR